MANPSKRGGTKKKKIKKIEKKKKTTRLGCDVISIESMHQSQIPAGSFAVYSRASHSFLSHVTRHGRGLSGYIQGKK